MSDLKARIGELQVQLDRHRRTGLKEYPTRTIFIDPLLEALGWDVRDPDEVELEYPTIDAKSVDYALKINRKPVALIEAKPLDDPLDDVKAITQVVGYAANDGVEWCVLTNGVRYRVYRSSERAAAPDKLLFEVSVDPRDEQGMSADEVASHLSRLSRDSLAGGILDELGEEIFTTAKVRKGLDRLFIDPSNSLVRMVREAAADPALTPVQIRNALSRIWHGHPGPSAISRVELPPAPTQQPDRVPRDQRDYGEQHHLEGKPAEVVELYRALDRFCQDLAPGQITRRHLAKYISWSRKGHIFCSVHVLDSKLRVWLKLDPRAIPPSVTYARDVSKVGHWGAGDVEVAIDTLDRLHEAQQLIHSSFDAQ
jgi:predicted transport protein